MVTTHTRKSTENEAATSKVEKPATAAGETAAESKANPSKKPASKTMADLAEGYLKHLEDEGKSHGTCFSYSMELRVACSELGEKTKIASLTAKRVGTFFDSDRVTLLKSGKPKSQLSIDKTRRVLRQALVFAVERKWLKVAPLPCVDTK